MSRAERAASGAADAAGLIVLGAFGIGTAEHTPLATQPDRDKVKERLRVGKGKSTEDKDDATVRGPKPGQVAKALNDREYALLVSNPRLTETSRHHVVLEQKVQNNPALGACV